jgi:hypothetical protein
VRRFELHRHNDSTGFSGTGLVAEGVEFRDGRVTVRWCVPGKPSSTVEWDCIADALEVHGHGGDTVIEWIDPDHLTLARVLAAQGRDAAARGHDHTGDRWTCGCDPWLLGIQAAAAAMGNIKIAVVAPTGEAPTGRDDAETGRVPPT